MSGFKPIPDEQHDVRGLGGLKPVPQNGADVQSMSVPTPVKATRPITKEAVQKAEAEESADNGNAESTSTA